jgi:MFS transporter, Spinster family, sphingosine-1-phosphate transporter
VPTRRSTAEAFQILISHALGDAGSPYLVGLISETIKKSLRTNELNLQYGKDALQSFSQLSENATTTVFTTIAQKPDSTSIKFQALQYSLFSTSFVEVLGGIFFLLTAAYILKDRANVDRAVAGENKFDW